MPASDLRGRLAALSASPAPWAIALAALVLQLPLALNPGYFSHDELQWAYFATRGHAFAWFDVAPFQYRPLTFNLWMWLSRHLFDTPQAFHAVLVAWGAVNVAGVYAVGRGLGIAGRHAAIAALVFALSPYAVVVHGWVGTIADLAWMSCALAAAWIALRGPNLVVAALGAAIATTLGLLAKEAALSIPVLALVAWAFTRERRWAAAAMGAGIAAAAYLAVRLDPMLHSDGQPALYVARLANVFVRWCEYQLYTPMVRALEAHQVLGIKAKYLAMAAIVWSGWIAALWRANHRLCLFSIVAGGAALGPVLLLGGAATHYGYVFAAVSVLCGAAAWTRTARWGRIAIATFALLTILHGIVVMGAMFMVGRVQSVFSPALAQLLRDRPADAPQLRLRPDQDAREWIFVRLTHHIPEYDGVVIEDRVRVVERSEAADYRIAPDGTLVPLAD